MSSVQPINYCNPQSYCTSIRPMQNISQMPPIISKTPTYIDLTDFYSQKELRDIIHKIGTNAPQLPNQINYVPRYTIQFFPHTEALVINNQSMTNDTTEILKDGSVRHVGSWHNKVVAPAGTCTNIIEEAKSRMDSNKVPS